MKTLYQKLFILAFPANEIEKIKNRRLIFKVCRTEEFFPRKTSVIKIDNKDNTCLLIVIIRKVIAYNSPYASIFKKKGIRKLACRLSALE